MRDSGITVGTLLLERYRVTGPLGSGGYGFVVAAIDETLQREVAVKLLHATRSNGHETQARFMREAAVCASLTSEYVTRIHAVEESSAFGPCIVMERLHGEDLGQRLARERVLPLPAVLRHALEAMVALAEAHAKGVVHRDLKPTNLFLAQTPRDVRVKVLDFGIAKLLETNDQLTSSGAMLGTLRYMAPEQLSSPHRVDHRADIWALAVVIYECLTGMPPFEVDSRSGIAGYLSRPPPVPLRVRRPDLPPQLEAALLRALAPQPDQRPPHLGELAQTLAPFAEPTAYSLVDSVQRFVSSSPRLVATAAASDPRLGYGPTLAQAPAQQPAPMVSAPPPAWVPSQPPQFAAPTATPAKRSNAGVVIAAVSVIALALVAGIARVGYTRWRGQLDASRAGDAAVAASAMGGAAFSSAASAVVAASPVAPEAASHAFVAPTAPGVRIGDAGRASIDAQAPAAPPSAAPTAPSAPKYPDTGTAYTRVPCTSDVTCPASSRCERGECLCNGINVMFCGGVCEPRSAKRCGKCLTCKANETCLRMDSDTQKCGVSCEAAGRISCDGTCVDAYLDPANCGRCRNRCDSSKSEVCFDGQCKRLGGLN